MPVPFFPGTSFTGPVDAPEFSGEKATAQDIDDAVTDAAVDQLKDVVKDAAKEDLTDPNATTDLCITG